LPPVGRGSHARNSNQGPQQVKRFQPFADITVVNRPLHQGINGFLDPFWKSDESRLYNPADSMPNRNQTQSKLATILRDSHFWIPAVVLILGLLLLFELSQGGAV